MDVKSNWENRKAIQEAEDMLKGYVGGVAGRAAFCFVLTLILRLDITFFLNEESGF
jgi:hypothetical protein